MHTEYEQAVERGLHRYVKLVAEAVGLAGNAYYAQTHPRAEAYLALDLRLPVFPELDTALLWDEGDGWALAVEPGAGADLAIVTYLAAPDPVPPPTVVAAFAKAACDGIPAGEPQPHPPEAGAADRLAAYAAELPAEDLW